MVWNSFRSSASNHAMWNMHNWDSATTDAYHLTAVARTAAFCHNDDLYRCLNRRHRKRYAADMPCVCWNGRIIRCAEGNRVSRDVQKMVLHPLFRGIVYEHVEGFAGGPHVHACQSHSIPRLIAERPFVDPPAVDGRQTIDDASTDCEFRVGGQFREMNRGYGMLSAGQYEFLPCFLHVLEDAQIGLEVIPCGGLDVGVSELPCDHADVGSGLDRQRAERVA